MKKLSLLIVVPVLLFMFSCGNDAASTAQKDNATTAQEDQLHQEIMAVHDEVMPWDAELNRQLRAVKKALADTGISEEKKKLLTDEKQYLETTHEEMMDWMASYAGPKKLRASKKTHEEIMASLKRSKAGVLKLKEAYAKVIEKAEKK